MQQLAERLGQQIEQDPLPDGELFMFHSLLLEMTGSKLVAAMQRGLVDFFRSSVTAAPPDAANADRIAGEHAELAAAIGDRDVERARAMICIQVGRYLPEADTGPCCTFPPQGTCS